MVMYFCHIYAGIDRPHSPTLRNHNDDRDEQILIITNNLQLSEVLSYMSLAKHSNVNKRTINTLLISSSQVYSILKMFKLMKCK